MLNKDRNLVLITAAFVFLSYGFRLISFIKIAINSQLTLPYIINSFGLVPLILKVGGDLFLLLSSFILMVGIKTKLFKNEANIISIYLSLLFLCILYSFVFWFMRNSPTTVSIFASYVNIWVALVYLIQGFWLLFLLKRIFLFADFKYSINV